MLWREIDRPEQEVIGIQYAGHVPEPHSLIVCGADHWLWEATGAHEGDEIEGLVADEVDRFFPRTGLPQHQLRVLLAHSPYTGPEGVARHQETSLYRGPSGAWVFASGTFACSPAIERPAHVDSRIQWATAKLWIASVNAPDAVTHAKFTVASAETLATMRNRAPMQSGSGERAAKQVGQHRVSTPPTRAGSVLA